MTLSYCPQCLEKQCQIDRLEEEKQSLRGRLNYWKRRAREGPFGSATPSAKVPVKPNTTPPRQTNQRGGRPGRPGAGRKAFNSAQADRVVELPPVAGPACPDCGGLLLAKGTRSRVVLDQPPLRIEKILYRIPHQYCPHCRRTFRAQPPGVLPKSLYGNQLLASVSAWHYLHGIPLPRIAQMLGAPPGSLVQALHRLARLLAQVPEPLAEQYRQSPVKHADETPWRTQGRNGYAWLFATDRLSLFRFRQTRSAAVPREVLGTQPLPGVLVVDRYAAYNQAPCAINYCYSHLLRLAQDLEKEFPDSAEVRRFVSTVAPLLTLAIGLRNQPISDAVFTRKARKVKADILQAMQAPAQHAGIRNIQQIFQENRHRLYHWADDRRVPADNNLAERDLRPTVIARKVSFGSQSDAGAHTRGVLMSVLHSLKKQGFDSANSLKKTLDLLADNPTLDPYPILFPP